MKKLLLLVAVVAMVLPGCQKINDALDELDDRLDKLEQEAIPTIDEQIAAINLSLTSLGAMDKELKGYIDDLTATASNLQEQINNTNTKIGEVKAALQNEISTAKAEVLAQLDAVKTELEGELAQINTTIATLQAKDAELDGKIAELKTYVDTELKSTTDWANATFATLEQYNGLVQEIATIKAQIEALNKSVSDLETKLTTKINNDIASAVATLNADIQQKVSEITTAYTNAISITKSDVVASYTAAISIAISGLETSMKSWVGQQLSGYYTIAQIDAKIAALSNAITNGDDALQQELNTLKNQLTTTANEITAAYKKAINDAINTNNGVINSKIANEIAAVNKRIDEEVAAINAKIAAIEARLDALEDKVDDLEDKIDLSINFDIEEDAAIIAGSIVKVNYTITNSSSECHIATIAQNGWSAVVTKSSDKNGYITVTSPKPLTNSPIMVFVSNSATTIMRTLSFVDGFVSVETDSYSVPFDATTLDINVQSNLDYTIEIPSLASSWISVKSVTSRAVVRNDVITLDIAENTDASGRTATIELLYDGTTVGSIEVYQQSQIIANNEIAYTTTDNKVLTLSSVIAFGSRIVSNTYNNGRGLIVCESDVTTIGDAFSSCPSLQTIKLPDSVTSIENYTFYGCKSLTSVTIPDSVTLIGDEAFYNCKSLTSVTIGNGVTSIGYYAFYGCTSLTSVTIPDSVTSIGDGAFVFCDSLTSVTIPNSVTSIGYYAFADCSRLTSVTIPDSVTSIGYNAFYGCTSLTSVTIPDSVTSIKDYTFYECRSLTSVTIPDSVTKIGNHAFDGCTSLTSVTIPDSVTSIGACAFYGCTSLTSVYCKPTTRPTLGSDALPTNNASLIIYVPTDSVDAYKAANGWKDYAFFIEGYDF